MIAAEIKYKKTGNEWVPEIPDHWDFRRLKNFAEIGSGQDQKGIENDNGKYSIYGTGGLMGKTNEFLYEGPSVILGRKGTIDNPFYVTEPFWTVDTAYYTKIKENVDPRFFFYCCLTIQFDYYKYGSAVPSMSQRDLNQIRLPYPPLDEQKVIANYLDVQSAKITRFIQTKQRFIELLKEQRQSIITNAVTKGIDDGVKMKETGIEWMPEVPEHWELRKIRRIYDGMSSGTTPESGNMKYYENGQTNWINTGDLNDGILYECKYKVTKKALDEYPTLKVYPIGTILVAMYGATIGKVSLMEIEGCTNQACCALYDSNIYSKDFSLFAFLAAKDALIRESYGGGQPNISQDVIKRFKLPVPPVEEQKRIVEHIKTETCTLDIAISKAEREIELIKEYREAMIAEAVTGKMKW